jgi:hypothetical protein
MTINEHDIERFLSGELPGDHPAWSQTAAFSQRLDSVFPTADGPLDAAQLAAVVNEARQLRTASALRRNLVPPPMKPSRVILAVAAAAVLAVTSGAGLAAALNGGLNQQASTLKLQAQEVPIAPVSQPVVTPVPTAEPSDDASELENVKPKVVHKSVTPKPKAKPKPTKTVTESHHEDDHEGDHEDDHEEDHEED